MHNPAIRVTANDACWDLVYRTMAEKVKQELSDSRQESEGPVSDLPLVIIIVLNWNLKDDLAECLNSLERMTYSNARVVVVDNASDDGSAEMVRDRFPSVHLIINQRNLGFAGGNNVGLRYALAHGTEYVLLLNNDTVVASDMVERLTAVARCESLLGILGPKILHYGTADRVWYLGHRISRWLPVPRRITPRLAERSGFPTWFEVDYLSGCSMLIRREVLDEVGLLDERLFMHYEDADFCQRVQRVGFRLACVPQARMWHKISQSSHREATNVRRAKARNRVLFYRRYPHGPHPWLTAAFLLGSSGIIMTKDLLHGNVELIRPHAQGLYEGFTVQLLHNEQSRQQDGNGNRCL